MSVFQNYNEQNSKNITLEKKKKTNLFTCVKKTVMYIRNTLEGCPFFQ